MAVTTVGKVAAAAAAEASVSRYSVTHDSALSDRASSDTKYSQLTTCWVRIPAFVNSGDVGDIHGLGAVPTFTHRIWVRFSLAAPHISQRCQQEGYPVKIAPVYLFAAIKGLIMSVTVTRRRLWYRNFGSRN